MTKILDCTIRDGGYYTNWDFDKQIIKAYFKAINHLAIEYLEIVSGSDRSELRFIYKKINISHYFKSISGSPTPKIKLVENTLNEKKYKLNNLVFICNSINDYDAAEIDKIDFMGCKVKNKKYCSLYKAI